MKCTNCQSDHSREARVCSTCGSPLSADPTLEDLYFSRLAANAPPKFAQKVRSAPFLGKERRMVTAIMFTVANVDAFKLRIPEEERKKLLNTALDRFAKIIFQYEGTIAKLWENTVLAFFGAPVTHEDDPLRAIHTAVAILEEVQDYSVDIENSHGVPLQIYMVLNTGPILIGDIKSNLKFNFQSLNNTLECMDHAIRGAIPHCEIILFDDTYQFIKPFVKCTKLDAISCEDTNEVLHLWRLSQVTNQPNNVQRELTQQNNTALVGRKKELDLLLELSETVLAGLGRVGLIIGEPGIGKSRLIMAWKHNMMKLHQTNQVRWIEAYGLAFGRELAYHLIKDLLRATLDISEITPKAKIKKVLHNNLSKMVNIDKENIYQYLAHLLDIHLSDSQEARIHNLNPQELRKQYLNAIRTYLLNLASEQPLIIVLEDLHWADASSVDLLIELLFLTSEAPILFCLASRKDRDSNGWDLVMAASKNFGSRLTMIELDNLDEQESQSLVKQIMGIEEIPKIVREMVLKKSEGNPSFIEELIRMLVNENALVRKNDGWVVSPKIDSNKIPDSLQGLLTARIDRLPPEAQTTLRIASVIGRTFPERVLELLTAKHAPNLDLMAQLNTLESLGMIKVSQVKPELTYKFQHILLHEAAYNSHFETGCEELHLSAGLVLEKLYPDQKNRLASQLAHHFLKGCDTKKAYSYLDLAGHVAMDSFATVEAEAFFRQAITLAEEPEKLAHQYTDLGEALAQQSKHREAIQSWKQAIKYHRELGNSDRLARIYAWSARSAWYGYDPKRSLEICLDGLKNLEEAIESPDIAYLIHETGRAYLFNHQPDKARTYTERALEMAKRLDAFDVQAEALATIGILPNVKPQQAIAALEMAVKISESNNLFGPASRAYINLASVIDNLGEISLARDYRKRAIQLGNKGGSVLNELLINQAITKASLWLADFKDAKTRIEKMRQLSRQNDAYLDEDTLNQLYLEGNLNRMMGDFTMAIEIFTDLIDRSRQINDLERVLQANRALAEVIIETHLIESDPGHQTNIEIALSMIVDSIRAGDRISLSLDVATQCLLSTIHALMGNLSKAEEALKLAKNVYHNHPIMQDRVRIILAQARHENARNNFSKALEHFDESVVMLEKMKGRWWLARVWLEMGIVHLKQNEPEDIDQAQNYFREAMAEFNNMGVNYYTDVTIDKLRQVKNSSRAQAIAHQKVTRELVEAGRVQHTFMPTHSPEIPGYEFSNVLLPANETSGDFFDFIDLGEGKTGIVIADVADKGAGAALYMAMSRTLIRTYAGERHLDPKNVIKEVNRRILSDTQHGIFLTAVFGILDPDRGTFTYVNAGHNPPYLLKTVDNKLTFTHLEKTGTVIGIFEKNTWEAQTIEIDPGDVLILYTDGICEAQNQSEEFFGNHRLIKTLKNAFSPSPEAFRNGILETVQAFTGPTPRLDDITLIVISRKAEKP